MVTMIYAGERPAPAEVLPTPNAWMALCPASDRELVEILKCVRAAVGHIVPLSDEQMQALNVPPLKSNKPADIAAHERAVADAVRTLMPFKVSFTYVHCCNRRQRRRAVLTENSRLGSGSWVASIWRRPEGRYGRGAEPTRRRY